jgi:hypothetical protein
MNHARDFSESRISIRRTYDGYQKESCPEEEGRREEEEVKAAPLRRSQSIDNIKGSGDGALF